MSTQDYLKKLAELFRANGNEENAAGAKKYMKDKFEYFGIGTPKRRSITRKFIEKYGVPENEKLEFVVKQLWNKEEREFQYFAMELLEMRLKSNVFISLELIEYLIVHKSWWDTVDFLAPKLAGEILRNDSKKRRNVAMQWMGMENIWLKRSALLMQLKYKKELDTDLLSELIKKCLYEKEFFIRKAIGWILREYSKTNPRFVLDFVKDNPISNLSRKEALKRIPSTK